MNALRPAQKTRAHTYFHTYSREYAHSHKQAHARTYHKNALHNQARYVYRD